MAYVAEEATELLHNEGRAIDLATWMTDLHEDLTHIPVNQLAIPGSHDSGAFWLDPSTPVCPDESSTIKNLVKIFGSCAKNIVVKWSLTQRLDITNQLQFGVRYFDMRNGYLQSEDDVHFVHGVYGHRIEDLLHVIQQFLAAHPGEIVILDFNHFYSMTDILHKKFSKSIISIFEGMIYSPSNKGTKFTLSDMRKDIKQVIVVYDNSAICQQHGEFWKSDVIYSPWPDTCSVSTLIKSLNQRFDSLKPSCFNVFQAILSPQTTTITGHIFSSLEKCLVQKCDKAVSKWLADVFASKQTGVNIVICDFVSLDGCPLDIIKLNDLLLKENNR